MTERSSGILLPISSLPSPYGIGTLGLAAYDIIDFLAAAGQSWWQILPAGSTSYGDSPYQSFSTFAGNPYFVDLDLLIGDGLLTKEEVEAPDWGADPSSVDYGALYANRFGLLALAERRGRGKYAEDVARFREENRSWLPDYALFMALKRHFGMRPWTEWPEDIRLRRDGAAERYAKLLEEDIRLFTFVQFLFFRQWAALKAYARSRGIGIIGDLPIYVAMDSADVWSAPEFFRLDEKNVPVEVAGVPPDYFSADGQLWGNPLYDWDGMARDGYGWWIRRIDGAGNLYDMVRIDHFRGFESFWAVPYGAETAKKGRWIKGPGMELISVLNGWFPNLSFIAEDLGILTPEVRELLEDSGWPGMKVLQFAFDAQTPSSYLPHVYERNCICYAGTHDNTTLEAWKEEAAPEDVAFAMKYLAVKDPAELRTAVLRAGMSSVAMLFVAQLQDWLGLGAEGRINAPGIPDGNWRWRLLPEQMTPDLIRRIRDMTALYGRVPEKTSGEDAAAAEA